MSAIITRKPRGERYTLTVGTAADLGFDEDGGKWVVCCDEHHTLVNVDTREIAMQTRGFDFCEDCSDEQQADIEKTERIAETWAALKAGAL